jgi:hypothetical protein
MRAAGADLGIYRVATGIGKLLIASLNKSGMSEWVNKRINE